MKNRIGRSQPVSPPALKPFSMLTSISSVIITHPHPSHDPLAFGHDPLVSSSCPQDHDPLAPPPRSIASRHLQSWRGPKRSVSISSFQPSTPPPGAARYRSLIRRGEVIKDSMCQKACDQGLWNSFIILTISGETGIE